MKEKKRKPPKQSRCDSATVELRIQEVLQIILDGAQEWSIRDYVAEKCKTGEAPWKVKRGLAYRTVGHYITDARRRIKAASIRGDVDRIDKTIAMRESLFARCVNAGDMSNARGVLNDINTLCDDYPAKKLDAKITGERPIRLIPHDDFYNNADRLEDSTPTPPSAPSPQ